MTVLQPLPIRFSLSVLAAVLLVACSGPSRQAVELPLSSAPTEESWQPGQIFADRLAKGRFGPEMMVIASGEFTLGSAGSDKNALPNEKPAHRVQLAEMFAIARTETTVAQFAAFVADTGHVTVAEQAGFSEVFDLASSKLVPGKGVNWRHDHLGKSSGDDFPVVHVAFADAEAYVQWLSRKTGKRYRLPTEAEWEYVLRAGTESVYPWGDKAKNLEKGNLTGELDVFPNGRNWRNAIARYRDGYWALAPVRQYSSEGFGTFDMTGNVSEWVQDCWHENYRRAPGNGQAWVNPGCTQRVVRGSAWLSAVTQARSSYRAPANARQTSARIGFRVVRAR